MRWENVITHSSRFITRVFNQLFPPACILCTYPTRSANSLCSRCQQDLPILPYHCQQCAQFLSPPTVNGLCTPCQHQPPPFDRTYALFPYQPPITSLIVQLKFHHQLAIARAIGHLFIQRFQQAYGGQPLPDLILPIPLHPNRLRERGFNQAVELARPIARAFNLPLDIKGVKRTKHTAAQSGLLAKEREHNIANAFTAYRAYSGLTIAVVDDVVTTGSTITECCKVLKQQGAKWIDVWCCARRG